MKKSECWRLITLVWLMFAVVATFAGQDTKAIICIGIVMMSVGFNQIFDHFEGQK